jgi:hypothetical protein
MSALYFAAAVRGNKGGIVIGPEIVPAKLSLPEAISLRRD